MLPAAPRFVAIDGGLAPLQMTSLRALGKDEKFLEELIGSSPDMLGLESYRTGIAGPFVAFHQCSLRTPQGRSVQPDIVLLSQSGHVVVVEVKLSDNPELKDRRVVGQVIEYAASLATYGEDDMADLLCSSDQAGATWSELVAGWFPNARLPRELAEEFLHKLSTASIHLVIACDGAPDGLRDTVGAVTSQEALGAYELHVVELVPYVASSATMLGILLLPTVPIRTQIVSRAAVTVSYEEGQPRPGVRVEVTSPEDVESAMHDARAGTQRQMCPELAEAIRLWDDTAPTDMRTVGTSPAYRQIKPRGWPNGIHYEFVEIRAGEQIAAEIHLEHDRVLFLQALLVQLAGDLKGSLPGVEWDQRWAKGRGRLIVRPGKNVDGATVIASMKALVDASLSPISAAIAKHNGAV